MEKELKEIHNQLTDLTRKVEMLLNSFGSSESVDSDKTADVGNNSDDTSQSDCSAPAAITFTLNDRFRFQRVIFGGSAERMSNAMSAISAMTTADEVYAYLTNVLDQNVEDPDVEDFFRAVTLRFADHKPLML